MELLEFEQDARAVRPYSPWKSIYDTPSSRSPGVSITGVLLDVGVLVHLTLRVGEQLVATSLEAVGGA